MNLKSNGLQKKKRNDYGLDKKRDLQWHKLLWLNIYKQIYINCVIITWTQFYDVPDGNIAYKNKWDYILQLCIISVNKLKDG